MREITKTVTYTEEETRYVASDGKEFMFSFECQEHEAKINPLSNRLEEIPHKDSPHRWLTEKYGIDCRQDFAHFCFVGFYIRNLEDAETLNAWGELFDFDFPKFGKSDVGTVQIFWVGRRSSIGDEEKDFSRMEYILSADKIKQEYEMYIDSFTKF